MYKLDLYKRPRILIILIIPLLLLTACLPDTPAQIVGTPRSRSIDAQPIISTYTDTEYENTPIPIPVLYRTQNTIPAIFEPLDGAYLAAWLSPHTCKRSFSSQAGKSHAAFVREMYLDEEIPINWLLQCLAELATPLLIIHPPRQQNQETEDHIPLGDQIAYLAHRLGSFNMPMFIAFYPPGMIPHSANISAAEYAVIFRYARALFLSYAPQTAFVWIAQDTNTTIRNAFFPGSDAVDWVGVPLFARRNVYGFAGNIIDTFAPFYHTFRDHHPIMVLPIGVSHFTRYDHIYNLEDAEKEIPRIYQALMSFPRVGLIAYADAFSINTSKQDDFSISVERSLMSAYGNAVEPEHFTSLLTGFTNVYHYDSPQPMWTRSTFLGYIYEGRLYIDVETLTAELSTSPPRVTVQIGERTFAPAENINRLQISFCENKQVILVSHPV